MLESSEEMLDTAKILLIGPPGVGKTLPGLLFPGPVAVLDGEDGVRVFRKEKGVPPFLREAFSGPEDLNAKLARIISTPSEMGSFRTMLIDGVTTAWHAALSKATGGTYGTVKMEDQAALKAHFKTLNSHVYDLGKGDKNVIVNAQGKNDWVIVKGQKPQLKGQKGDVDDRIWYAFDFVFILDFAPDGSRVATVLKTRLHGEYPMGMQIRNFTPQHLLALVGADAPPAAKVVASAAQDVGAGKDEGRKKLVALARELGSVSKGGVISDGLAGEIRNALESKADAAVFEGLFARVRREQLLARAQELRSESNGGSIPDAMARRVAAALAGDGVSVEEITSLLEEMAGLRVPVAA